MERLERLSTFSNLKYEKVFMFSIIIFLFFISSCRSTGIYDNIESTTETRIHIGELQSEQAELNGISTEVTEGIQGVTEDNQQAAERIEYTTKEIERLEGIIEHGTEQDVMFAEILREIYLQPARSEPKPP